jgi:DNA-binding LacI/PurR family transcriptional regulator
MARADVASSQDVGGRSLRPGPANIRDVARIAGVSSQTVSRVLNRHPNVRASTRARVLAAMGELSFRPSRAARTLSARRSQTIGLLAAEGAYYAQAKCISAVEDAARARGYYTAVARLDGTSPHSVSAAVEDLIGQDVEGIVAVTPPTGLLPSLTRLLDGVPVVAAQGDPGDAERVPVVTVDQDQAVRMMLRYLIGQGHKRILHLAGPQESYDARVRLEACQSELRSADLPVLSPTFGDWTAESGYTAGQELVWGQLAGRGKGLGFTAAFSASDQMALGLIHAIREAGFDVPGDVSVAGFDDIPEAAHFWPPLTTVRLEFGDLGGKCVALLIDAIRGVRDSDGAMALAEEPEARARLVVRNSVAAARPAVETQDAP